MKDGRLLVAVLVAAGVLVALATAIGRGGESSPRPEDVVLRLSDLPRGYTIGDDSFCGQPLGVEGMPDDLRALVSREKPSACYRQFEMPASSGAGLHLIESAAIAFSSESAASEAFASLGGLLHYLGITPAGDAGPAPLGDESRTLFTAGAEPGDTGVLVAWRNGRLVSLVRVARMEGRQPLSYAVELARLQDGRIDNPEPVASADTDDREAALDRPGLGVPVYWLGTDFEGGGDLPGLVLARSGGGVAPGGSPGNRVSLQYEDPSDRGPAGARVILTVWRAEDWRSFLQTPLGDLATAPPCAEPTVIALPDRRIEIHPPSPLAPSSGSPPPPATVFPAGSVTPPTQSTPAVATNTACPSGFVGHVYFEDAVVVINLPICPTCLPPPGAYDSPVGIEAVGRALQRR